MDYYTEALRFGKLAEKWSKTVSHQVIHAHDWMTYPAAMKASKKSHKPWVAHIHATEYDRTGGYINPQIAQIEYEGLNAADQVIAVSDYTQKVIKKRYGVSQKKITVVHNGVDAIDFAPRDIKKIFPNDNVVIYVGRLTFQKGVDYFLQMAKEVLHKHPKTVFVIVGDGDMYQRHMLEAARLGISNRVIFTGFLSGEKLKNMYHMADAFVMPSVSEPYGIVALEAIATGTPAIISNQSGVSESIRHALKVDFWDVQRMAYLTNQVLSNKQKAAQLAKLARREIANMTWDKAASQTMQVYKYLTAS